MLPGYDVCGECEGSGKDTSFTVGPLDSRGDVWALRYDSCRSCSGVGSVPNDATVEAVAPTLLDNDRAYSPPYWSDCDDGMKDWYRDQARAALVAYAQHVEPQQEAVRVHRLTVEEGHTHVVFDLAPGTYDVVPYAQHANETQAETLWLLPHDSKHLRGTLWTGPPTTGQGHVVLVVHLDEPDTSKETQ